MIYCGIDISKKTFDVALLTDEAYKIHVFSNNCDGLSNSTVPLKPYILLRLPIAILIFSKHMKGCSPINI